MSSSKPSGGQAHPDAVGNHSLKHSVAGVAFSRGRTLLALRKSAGGEMDGRWELPGGKCEAGETHCQALIREFEEEFSVRIRCGEFLAKCRFVHRRQHYVVSAYAVHLNDKILKLREHREVRWFTPAEIDELLASPDAIVSSDRDLLVLMRAGEGNGSQT